MNPHNQEFMIKFSYAQLEELWFTLGKRIERGCPDNSKERLRPLLEYLNYILARHTPGVASGIPRMPEFESRFIQVQSDICTPGHELERMSKVSELCKQMLPTKRLIIK